MSDCIFCKIVRGEIPATFIYEDDHLVVFKDTHPVAPVHVLIVPKKHVANIVELAGCTDGEVLLGQVLRAIPAVAKLLHVDAAGFRLINNCGRDGGQTIEHVHFHLIGGKALGDGLIP